MDRIATLDCFFSSRRRHTRYWRDWSSDVCSSDLPRTPEERPSMATMTVWKFPTAGGADRAEATLKDLQRRELIRIHDAALVTYPDGAKKPKTRQLNNLAGAGALGGAFWGMLFGLIFFIPLLGLAIGAGMGALMGSMGDVGIDDK